MRRPCLRVPKRLASEAIALLKSLGLLERGLKVGREGESVLIPLARWHERGELKELERELASFELSKADFEPREERPSLLALLSRSIPPELLDLAPRAFDIVGDIAIVELRPELWPYRRHVGSAIMALHKRVRLVLAKGGPVSGAFRLRPLTPIAGSGPTETAHREHGCVFWLDVARTYFSPRLSYEHARVASQVRRGEVVVDMFAGIGPFSILMARRAGSIVAYAIDINPVAIHYLARNVRANKVVGSVVPVLSDAGDAVEAALSGLADRVVMNLPEKAVEFVRSACEALKPEGGILHFYTFAGAPNPELEATRALVTSVEQAGRTVKRVLLARRVRAVAPFRWQVVVDAEVA